MENNPQYNLTDSEDIKKLYKYLTSYFIKIRSRESREDAIQETFMRLLELHKDIVNFYDDIKSLQGRVKGKIERDDRKVLLDENIEKNANNNSMEYPSSGSLVIECAVCNKKVKKFISKIKKANVIFCSNNCRSLYYHPSYEKQ